MPARQSALRTVRVPEPMVPLFVVDRTGAAIADFHGDGFCILDGTLPPAWVEECREAALGRLEACLDQATAAGADPLAVGTEQGFAEIVHRAPGRYDVLHGTDSAPFTRHTGEDAPWMDAVRRLLGAECRRVYRGLLVARPGCAEQPWHADGEHLFPGSGMHLPVHCLNVFVPLVDLSAENGPTEFCPGTHRLTGGLSRAFEQDWDLLGRIGYRGEPVVPTVAAGSVLLFDYRLVHRGLANRSNRTRPVLYLTYAAPWFADVRNFPERRLFG